MNQAQPYKRITVAFPEQENNKLNSTIYVLGSPYGTNYFVRCGIHKAARVLAGRLQEPADRDLSVEPLNLEDDLGIDSLPDIFKKRSTRYLHTFVLPNKEFETVENMAVVTRRSPNDVVRAATQLEIQATQANPLWGYYEELFKSEAAAADERLRRQLGLEPEQE